MNTDNHRDRPGPLQGRSSPPLFTWQLSDSEKIEASLVDFGGQPFLSLWVYCLTPDGTYEPGGKGLMVALAFLPDLSPAILPELARAVAVVQGAAVHPSKVH